MRKRFGTGTMLIPRPRDVVAVMRRPRKGRLITAAQIRDELARMAGADSACPMTTGMFILIAAEAAEEARRAGRKRITPYWRTVKDGGKLNERFPGGVRAQAARLREEGLTIRAGKGRQPPTVEDFEKHLVRPQRAAGGIATSERENKSPVRGMNLAQATWRRGCSSASR
ncbi:MAG: MGMT family protein [Phycisphaerae bacterium]|jgi:hypothetical protein